MNKDKRITEREKLRKLAPVADAKLQKHIFVCTGKSCSKVGAEDVLSAFKIGLEKRGLRFGRASKGRNPSGNVMLTTCGSVGFCSVGTAVIIYPEGIWYAQVNAGDVEEIIENHIIGGEAVERLVLKRFAS